MVTISSMETDSLTITSEVHLQSATSCLNECSRKNGIVHKNIKIKEAAANFFSLPSDPPTWRSTNLITIPNPRFGVIT